MALTLKTTGLATALISCVAVDDDGTIKDFVGNAITLGAGVAATVTDGTWKSQSRKHFSTLADGSFGFFGVIWDTPRPVVNPQDADGVGYFFACAGASAVSGAGPFLSIGAALGTTDGLRRTGTKLTYVIGDSPAVTVSDIPTNGTTQFSVGYNFKSSDTSGAFFGLESGALALEHTAATGNWGGAATALQSIGGAPGQGNQVHKPYLYAAFNRMLTEAEYQSLHNDWLAVLFESGDTTPPVITGPTGAAGASSISVSVAENTTACGTWAANESVAWSLNGGADAAFFSINSSTGALSFTSGRDYEDPQDAGANNSYIVVVRATDGAGNTSDQTVTVNVTNAGFSFSGTVPTMNGTVGVSFSQSVAGYFVGTDTPYNYAVHAGTLPAGLSLNSSTGVISGTPTTPGSATGVVVRATDEGGATADTNSFTISIAAALATALTFTLADPAGSPRASLTAQKGAVFAEPTPDLWTTPVLQFDDETSNGSGVMTLDITGLGLHVGDVCSVVLTNSDGDPAQSPVAFGTFFLATAA